MFSIFKTKIFYLLPLFFLCIATLLLVLPTINNNVNNPNMIVYFNADEGGFMDVIWHYYSGIKRDSFQWDFDYGLEMVYLSDLARFLPSKFINFTPGTFILILRWLHLVAWILSLIALWGLVRRHFKRIWQPFLVVILLALRPAFAYFSLNLKPEPMALLFIIIGLDYSLRVVETPSRRNLCLAVACAALAFIIKYVGIFLLPAIVASMYFAELNRRRSGYNKLIFPRFTAFWVFPALVGFILMALPLAIIMFYVRKSTGVTWYQGYGLWGSLFQNRAGLHSFITGIFFVSLAGIIWAVSKNTNPLLKKITEYLKTINSYALFIFAIFLGFVFLFGFRWLIAPHYFILNYAFLGSTAPAEALKILAGGGLLHSFLYSLAKKIGELDPIIFFLFILYVVLEIRYWSKSLSEKSVLMFKRLVLLVFVIPFLFFICLMLRLAQHHMLPFFIALVILVTEGPHLLESKFAGGRVMKNIILGLIALLFLVDITINGAITIKSRIRQFHQKDDIAYEIEEWWRKNIPAEAKIVADHYVNVYIPFGYWNIRTLDWNGLSRSGQLRRLVDAYRPQFIYYNTGRVGEDVIPPIEEILPGRRIKLVKSFESNGRRYQRRPGDSFVIYEVLY